MCVYVKRVLELYVHIQISSINTKQWVFPVASHVPIHEAPSTTPLVSCGKPKRLRPEHGSSLAWEAGIPFLQAGMLGRNSSHSLP